MRTDKDVHDDPLINGLRIFNVDCQAITYRMFVDEPPATPGPVSLSNLSKVPVSLKFLGQISKPLSRDQRH